MWPPKPGQACGHRPSQARPSPSLALARPEPGPRRYSLARSESSPPLTSVALFVAPSRHAVRPGGGCSESRPTPSHGRLRVTADSESRPTPSHGRLRVTADLSTALGGQGNLRHRLAGLRKIRRRCCAPGRERECVCERERVCVCVCVSTLPRVRGRVEALLRSRAVKDGAQGSRAVQCGQR